MINSETRNAFGSVADENIYLYAFSWNWDGIRKNGLLSISFSGAKEQAITYKNGSIVKHANTPSIIVLNPSKTIEPHDLFVCIR